jgi:bloom syndrome protein
MNNKKVESVLKSIFGFSSLKPFQQKVLEIAFSGTDILILSPTGSGKSLCYQLPSLIDSGMTLVISPLRSLIHDQVTKLKQLNVSVAVMTGDVATDEKKEVNNKISKWDKGTISCPYKLFYTTPEMITYNKSVIALLTNLYKKGYLSRVVIDEAHCVSTWGHDFRDSYLTLGQIRQFFPKTPIMALTATATPKVKKDIIYLLDIPNCTVLTSSFRRHNLKLEIIRRDKGSLMDIRDTIIRKFNGQSGIVYCHSRKDCKRISDSLSLCLKADYYHAGLDDDKRKQIQNDWIKNKIQVIVATIAFGMGIDKPNVRFVIHYNMPMSVENYYQEIGRAGRDGKDSTCILYFSYSDKIIYEKIIRQNIGDSMSDGKKNIEGHCHMLDTDDESDHEIDEVAPEVDAITKKKTAFQSYQLNKLYDMITYIENITDCRHVLLSNYFGENIDLQEELCHTYCNNCLENLGKIANKDLTVEAGFLCQIIMEISHKNIDPTRKNVIDSFMAEPKSYNVIGYGKGKSLGKENSERLLSYMIREKYIKEDLVMNNFNYWIDKLTLRKRSKKVIAGKTQIILPVKDSLANSSYFDKVEEERLLMKDRIYKDKIAKKKAKFDEEDGEDTDYKNDPLYNDLQKFRSEYAKNNNMPLYRVFDNKTLRDLVLKKPANEKELGNVYGIATKRIQEYGDDILNVIALGWDNLNDIKQS